MSRILGIASIVAVVLLAMAFAAANAGHWTTLDLGIITLYRVPVTLVAFSGLLTGMLVMFAVGISSDLKVRRILRERLAEEAQKEQSRIDGHQQDLFALSEDEVNETEGAEPEGAETVMVETTVPLHESQDEPDTVSPGPFHGLDNMDTEEETPKE